MKDKVCLLITTFNRGHLLKNSLERLTNLTLPDEVLVVSDGCSDNTEEVCKSFESRLPIRYIYNHNPAWSICSYARNIGIKNTECDIVITCEPEILFITDNIKEIVSLHYRNPNQVINVGTIYHQGKDGTTHQDTIDKGWLDMSMVNESEHNTNPINTQGHVRIQNWVAPFCALYRREWLMGIGGWNEELTGAWGYEDILILTRLRIKGVGQYTVKELEAVHQWHEKLPPHIQRKSCQENEEYMKSLRLDDENPNNPNLIANQNKEWGVVIPRN